MVTFDVACNINPSCTRLCSCIQANKRSIDMFDQWTSEKGRNHMDQVYLNNLNTEAYVFCTSHATCRSAQGHGKFALFR